MSNILSIIDPVMSIDYSVILNKLDNANAIKEFSNALSISNSYSLLNDSNASLLNVFDESSANIIPQDNTIYLNLYKYNNLLTQNFNINFNSLYDKNNTYPNNIYKNEYQENLNNALHSLYSSIKSFNNYDFLDIINDKNYSSFIEIENKVLYFKQGSSNNKKIICYKDKYTNETKEINIDTININDLNSLNSLDLSCYIAYHISKDNKFPSKISKILNFTNEKVTYDIETLKLISFAKELKNYNEVYIDYKNTEERLKKLKNEQAKIDALFTLIDTINSMYSKYNEYLKKEERKSYNT